MAAVDLFLLGAPKCATTSFYDHLSRHPAAWCPPVKEPGWFTRDEVRDEVRAAAPHLRDYAGYLALYRTDRPDVAMRCDGSTSYLRSPEAMRAIDAAFPAAHAVAVVRDPVELVSSYYVFLRHEGWEDQPSLEAAWEVQEARRAGAAIPAGARRPSSLVYADVAMLGRQVRAARETFGERLRVYTLGDLRRALPEVSREVQAFAGLDPIDLGDLPQLNPARTARRAWLNRLAKTPPKPVARLRDALKRGLGVSSLGLRKGVDGINSATVERQVSPETVRRLRDHFRDDVALLSREMSRDLFAEWKWA